MRRLVQWCHGGPGMMFLLPLAVKVFPQLKAAAATHAVKAAEVVWQRGLLCSMWSEW